MYLAAARARGGRPRIGLFVPAAGRCRGSGAGHAPRWGCPWRVPLASVLDCVRCAGLRVWTQSLTRPVSRTARLSTGDSVGAPGLFDVDTDTASFGSEDAKPGSCACVRVLAPLGRVGRAGLPGAFLCASPCGLSRCSVCMLGPLRAGVPPLVLVLCFFFVFFSYVRPCCLWRSVSSSPGFLGPPASCAPPPHVFFVPSPLLPPCVLFFCLPFFVFSLFVCFQLSFFSSCCAVPVVRCSGCLCVLGCGVGCRVLLWAFCPGGGRFALALCRSVLPGCACSLCVVACRLACVQWRRAGAVSLPRAASSVLLVCFVFWSCSAVLAACRCPWVLCWGCPVARGLLVLFCPALVSVVLASLVWCLAPFWGAMWCCLPRPRLLCPVVCFWSGVCWLCWPPRPPARLVVMPCVVCCRASRPVVLRSVMCFVLGCVCVPCCPARCCAVSCCAVFFCSAVVCCCALCCFFFCVVPCLSVVHRAVSVCFGLCRGASCCWAWPCRVAFLC